DVVVGNPPYAGKNTIAEGHPAGYVEWLQALHPGAHGNADLVAHFFRRAFTLLRRDGCFGLIATNTIRQGDTRETGLRPILSAGGTIIAARRRLVWPGAAAVVVSVVHMLKGLADAPPVLDGKQVSRISAFLVEGEQDATPAPLRANAGIAFVGSYLLGMGFTFDDRTSDPGANRLAEMARLIAKDPRNAERIRPYIGGEEVNNSPTHAHHRYAIDFADFPLRREAMDGTWQDADERQRQKWLTRGIVPLDYPDPVAADWPDLLTIVEERVKPERTQLKDENSTGKRRKEFWWQWGGNTPGLYAAIRGLDRVLAISRTTKHSAFAFLSTELVFAERLCIFRNRSYGFFTTLQSNVHEIWARFFGTTQTDRLIYTPSDAFDNFPLPDGATNRVAMEQAGKDYYEARAALMQSTNKGLTETYNRFNDPEDQAPAIIRLRTLHAAMDRAVLDAYGWTDLHPVAIHEREWEAQDEDEKPAPWRLRWPEADRDTVLARLLDLNRSRHEVEAQAEAAATPARKRRGRASPTSTAPLFE
uniref:Eco57I restriction-modification methylase domain-containing protein n=1 Tax=Acidiphilium sp. TaxID=527 RepID=UPI00338E9466